MTRLCDSTMASLSSAVYSISTKTVPSWIP